MEKQRNGHGMRNLRVLPSTGNAAKPNERRRQIPVIPQKAKPSFSQQQHQSKDVPVKTPTKNEEQVLRKLYVLDTNVIMHDWNSLLRFKEHDIFLCVMVVRELDRNKKGLEEAAWNSRRASNFIEELIQKMEKEVPNWTIKDGLDLTCAEGGAPGMGRIFIQTEEESNQAMRLAGGTNATGDDFIMSATRLLINMRGKHYSEIRLVSKDLNMRILARTRDLLVDDYTTDLVVTNADKGVYSGMIALPEVVQGKTQVHRPSEGGELPSYEIDIPEGVELYVNQLVTDDTNGVGWIVSRTEGNIAEIRHCRNYIGKNAMLGINARNREQNFLLNLLMDTEIDFVTILGDAGTGKTLLSIVAALEQKKSGIYDGIIFTRATVPVGGEEIGFLPGTEHEKMGSWLGALEDNLEVIAEAMANKHSGGDKMKRLQEKHSRGNGGLPDFGEDTAKTESMSALHREFYLKSISFMRGRTFLRRYIIIDEAQNLTPKQMKTLITRSGPGTKVICLGNLDQIDTPYLTESSSGLAFAVEAFKGWRHYAHITLARGERSRLAERAVEVM